MSQITKIQDGVTTYRSADPTEALQFNVDGEISVNGVGVSPDGIISTTVGGNLLITTNGNGNITIAPGGSGVLTLAGYSGGSSSTTLTGDITGTGTGTVSTTLADTTVSPGTYTHATIIVDSKGRITYAESGAAGGVSSFNGRNGAITLLYSDVSDVMPLGGVTVPNFSLSETGPIQDSSTSSYFVVPNTLPAGWNTRSGRCTLEFELYINNYFSANPSGHFSIVTRLDASVVATDIEGTGATFGNFTSAAMTNGVTVNYTPSAVLESWCTTTGPGGLVSWLIGNTETPNNKPLRDSGTYKIFVESAQMEDNDRYIRYRIYEWVSAKYIWQLMHDTGDVLDPNIGYADLTNHGLDFAQVSASNSSAWSLDFSNIKCTWGPPHGSNSELSSKLNKTAATIVNSVATVSGTSQLAVAGTQYALSNGSMTTVTLPANPVEGDTVWVTPTNGLNTNVIARNGHTIMGLAEDMIIDTPFTTIRLRYVNASWRAV